MNSSKANPPITCSFCGKPITQDNTLFIQPFGCCPVCKHCYKHLTAKKTKILLSKGIVRR